MTIATLDDFIGSAKQQITMFKSGARTTIAAIPFSLFELAGQPGAGTLAGTSTTAGVVPTDADAGFPVINAFTGGAKGYLASVLASSTVAGTIYLYDMLWKGGAYAFNANVTLSAQPSYSGRVPGGTDYSATELWLETVTAFTGNQSIAVTYTNEAGTAGRTTGTIALGVAPTLGRMTRLPLQAGDLGIQKVESVVSTVSTVGTFNVLVMRRLATLRMHNTNGVDALDFAQLGMPEIFDTSALCMVVKPDSTASGIPELFLTIANK